MFRLHTSNLSKLTPPVGSRKFVLTMFSAGFFFWTGVADSFVQTLSSLQPVAVAMSADYERLRMGMTLVEARSLLGPGTEISRSDLAVVVEWYGFGRQPITAEFKDDELVRKAQPGLQ